MQADSMPPLTQIIHDIAPCSVRIYPHGVPDRMHADGVTRMGRVLAMLAAMVLAAHCGAGAASAAELPANDYPTVARADYVFGCMQVNGQTRDTLERCSCSIDVIASLLPYEQYEEAETVMRVRQRGGKNASMFLTMPMLRAKVDDLKRAQIEAELRCF
jgi:hypothetical protein